MEYELHRVEDGFFSEYYEGEVPGVRRVVCILDDNCVRYMVSEWGRRGWSQKTRRCYGNEPRSKALCLANATKALNRF